MEENKINQELTTEEVKLQITEIIEEAKKSREAARLASKSSMSFRQRNPLSAQASVRSFSRLFGWHSAKLP